MIILGKKIAGRLAAMIVTGIVLLLLFGLTLDQCSRKKTAGKEAEIAQGQSGAAISTAEEAGNTMANVSSNAAATDALVGMGQAEIAAAAKGTKGKAAKRAACRMKAYRDTPQCQETVR